VEGKDAKKPQPGLRGPDKSAALPRKGDGVLNCGGVGEMENPLGGSVGCLVGLDQRERR